MGETVEEQRWQPDRIGIRHVDQHRPDAHCTLLTHVHIAKICDAVCCFGRFPHSVAGMTFALRRRSRR